MLIHNLTDEQLIEMKMRLLMEGVINRDADMKDWASKMQSVLQKFREDFWAAREYARKNNSEEEARRCWEAHALAGSVLDELDALIKERE